MNVDHVFMYHSPTAEQRRVRRADAVSTPPDAPYKMAQRAAEHQIARHRRFGVRAVAAADPKQLMEMDLQLDRERKGRHEADLRSQRSKA